MHLKHGAVLQGGKYKIEKLLGQGGFGITYLAVQTGLDRKVAIKEFFMKEHCNRDADTSHVSVPSVGSRELVAKFKEKFIKEAQMISGYKHPNIVIIHDVFEENGTAYYVMEYHGGGSLSSLSLPLSYEEASGYIRQVASALSYLHDHNTMHLDVKPSNVLIDSDGNAVLIDFGVSKRYDQAGHQTSSTPVGISHGYAPGEQYQQGTLAFSPATDIYALGATFYKLVTGDTPPDQNEVNENGLPPFPATVPASIAALIEKSMQPRRKDRPQSISGFLGMLDEALVASTGDETKVDSEDDASTVIFGNDKVDVDSGDKTPTPSEKKKSRRWLWWLLAAVMLAVAGVAAVMSSKSAGDAAVALSTSKTGVHNGHQWVDLGLPSGLKWATCNVGASSPEDYGCYYSWGDTKVRKEYTLGCCSSWGRPWVNLSGSVYYDAASANWGGDWRMPTSEEFQELIENCIWTWKTSEYYSGYEVKSNINGNSIFIPAAGNFIAEYIADIGDGFYWSASSSKDNTLMAESLSFNEDGQYIHEYSRHLGCNVRPVMPNEISSNGNATIGDNESKNVDYYDKFSAVLCSSDTSKCISTASLYIKIWENMNVTYHINGSADAKNINEVETALEELLADDQSQVICVYVDEDVPSSSVVQILEIAKRYGYKVILDSFQTNSILVGKHNGYEWVDLGLSVKWSTINVGASYYGSNGGHYAWGEILSREDGNNSADLLYEEYIGDICGMGLYDAARANWGGNWRMPTISELQELKDNCTWIWTTRNGNDGYIVTGPTGQQIFLPAAGCCYGSELDDDGWVGGYWSSTPDESDTADAQYLIFDENSRDVDSYHRYHARSIRPVLED